MKVQYFLYPPLSSLNKQIDYYQFNHLLKLILMK